MTTLEKREELLVACCVCGRIRVGTQWQHDALPSRSSGLSHGYCPACFEKAMAEVFTHIGGKTLQMAG